MPTVNGRREERIREEAGRGEIGRKRKQGVIVRATVSHVDFRFASQRKTPNQQPTSKSRSIWVGRLQRKDLDRQMTLRKSAKAPLASDAHDSRAGAGAALRPGECFSLLPSDGRSKLPRQAYACRPTCRNLRVWRLIGKPAAQSRFVLSSAQENGRPCATSTSRIRQRNESVWRKRTDPSAVKAERKRVSGDEAGRICPLMPSICSLGRKFSRQGAWTPCS